VKKIISISGDIGSGKSSVASELKELTSYGVIGTGNIQRAIAEQRGITTLELNKISQTDRSVDDEIDSHVIQLGKEKDSLIVDSRLAWHFIPDSFKVYLSVDPMIGSERVFKAKRSSEENSSLEQTFLNNLERQQLEDVRFSKLYDIRFRKYHNYDLIIDTSYTSPKLIAEKIKQCYEQWLTGKIPVQLWINPKKLFPCKNEQYSANAAYQETLQSMQKQGYLIEQPIFVFCHQQCVYIWDGHKRIQIAEKLGVPLIPANILTEDASFQLVKGESVKQLTEKMDDKFYQDWEKAMQFEYKAYPEKYAQFG
jgi:cytidylate kinase